MRAERDGIADTQKWRRIDEDEVGAGLDVAEDPRDGRLGSELVGIVEGVACGENLQLAETTSPLVRVQDVDLLERIVELGVVKRQIREARFCVEIEKLVQARTAEIGVDQDHAAPAAGEGERRDSQRSSTSPPRRRRS